MGLIVRGKTAGEQYDFVPDVLGNKKTASPMAIRMKVPSRGIMRKLASLANAGDFSQYCEELSQAVVIEVFNYALPNGQEIRIARDFAQHADNEVMLALIEEVKRATGEDEEEDTKKA